jgi:hypothetical protein
VNAVANEIDVRLPTSGERTDADIAAAAVRGAGMGCLRSDRQIRRHRLEGLGDDQGEVEWQFQKQDVERVVRRVTGVKGVSNLVTVNPRPAPSDLKKKIEELVRTAQSDAQRITVDVDGSKVILEPDVGARIGCSSAPSFGDEPPRPAALASGYSETVMRLSTVVTPGAAHAWRAASSFSAQERTVPLRVDVSHSAGPRA